MAQGGRDLWGHSSRTYTEAGSAVRVRGTMPPQPSDRRSPREPTESNRIVMDPAHFATAATSAAAAAPPNSFGSGNPLRRAFSRASL